MKIKEYYRASSLEEAYSKLQEDPSNALVAGGLWIKKVNQNHNTLIDLSTLGLNKISEKSDAVEVGALVTLRDFESSPIVNSLYGGAIAFAIREIMGVNFRNLATIGGSIMGRYPFSDVITGLLPYDVTLEFYPKSSMTLEEYLNYKGKLNAILTKVIIKKEEGKGFYKKVKTTALDFPILNIAVSKVSNKFSIAVGARPMTGALAHKAMDLLNNKKVISDKDIEEASELVSKELMFLDNKDASKEYRLDLAKVYVKRGLKEVSK
ncbi:MAG: FAD binding domain-containing protein [Bacilli bacterium]|nr:FAD binding domain-containing protein [Bacilli bacterium]